MMIDVAGEALAPQGREVAAAPYSAWTVGVAAPPPVSRAVPMEAEVPSFDWSI